MAYFRCVGGVGGGAVLTLTYSSEFYGETITATDGTKTVTKVAPSTGTMDITLPESGTWVVSATIDGQAYSTTVTVNLGYTASLEAIPDGSTVTPTDDIQTWLKCAGIRDKTTYTTLSDVLSDTDTLIALCADSNACDYMARSTNWASGVAADSTAMLIVGKYNYCANALLSNATWCETLAASSYWEYVFDICVPKMTGTTTPSGSATASSTNGSNYPWKAFDRNTSDWWQTTSSTSAWLQYVFPSPVCIKCVGVYTSQAASQTFDLWLSNDESTWTKYEDIFETITTEKLYTASINNNNSYRYARLVINCPTATYLTVRDCQFYGRTPNEYIPLVPVMTSNTTPSGVASASTVLSDGQQDFNAYKVFDKSLASIWQASSNTNQWVDYEFPTAVQCDRATFRAPYFDNQASRIKQYKIQGSNDGSNYTDLTEVLTCPNTRDGSHVYTPLQTVDFTKNKGTYTHYRLFVIDIWNAQSSWYTACYELQFYKKAEGITIHSAVEDSIFYMDDGSPVALCGIPVGDTIDVDMESFKGQTLTLVSTVAKDPTNLSNDFSMNVRITPNITEIYLMPYGALYWWGYESSNLEDITSTNGWTGYSTLIAPDHNTNSISKGDVNYNSGIGSKTAVSATSAYCIGYGVGNNTSLTNSSSKALSSYIKTQRLNGVATPALASITGLTGDTYINVWGNLDSGRNIFVNALWYE